MSTLLLADHLFQLSTVRYKLCGALLMAIIAKGKVFYAADGNRDGTHF